MDYQLLLWGDKVAIKPPKKKKKRKASKSPKQREVVADFVLLGAGVQSSTIVEMIVLGELEKPEAVIFADTGNEPPWVYEQVAYLRKRLEGINIPLVLVENGHIIDDLRLALKRFASMPLYTLSRKGKKGMLRRQCTNEYKIVPADNYVKNWMIENEHGKWSKPDKNGRIRRLIHPRKAVRYWYGITTEESFRMAKSHSWRLNHYPLIEKKMSRTDCVKWLTEHSLPIPKKSSCIVCPYHGDEFWFMLYKDEPDVFEFACKFDDSLRDPDSDYYFQRSRDSVYLHKSCKPLREIDFETLMDKKKRDALKLELVLSRPCGFDGGFSCST